MDPEKQRIKIAEACEWEWKPYGDCMAWYRHGKMVWNQTVDTLIPKKATTPLPNYPGDLNAMHEATMAQPNAVRVKINHTLMEILQPNDAYALDRTINATAPQRAEAFLRTLGLWEEEKGTK